MELRSPRTLGAWEKRGRRVPGGSGASGELTRETIRRDADARSFLCRVSVWSVTDEDGGDGRAHFSSSPCGSSADPLESIGRADRLTHCRFTCRTVRPGLDVRCCSPLRLATAMFLPIPAEVELATWGSVRFGC